MFKSELPPPWYFGLYPEGYLYQHWPVPVLTWKIPLLFSYCVDEGS